MTGVLRSDFTVSWVNLVRLYVLRQGCERYRDSLSDMLCNQLYIAYGGKEIKGDMVKQLYQWSI